MKYTGVRTHILFLIIGKDVSVNELTGTLPMQWSFSQDKYTKDCLCVESVDDAGDGYDLERIIKNLHMEEIQK